ncbi:hypothetical protein D3C76_1241890 [compost metagenome]
MGTDVGASASVEEMIGPPMGSIGKLTLFDPVASTRCSHWMRVSPTSTVLPSTTLAQPWMTWTLCFFSRAATPVVRRSTMPSFHSTLLPISRVGAETLMPRAECWL